jgi:hypothetical protein
LDGVLITKNSNQSSKIISAKPRFPTNIKDKVKDDIKNQMYDFPSYDDDELE